MRRRGSSGDRHAFLGALLVSLLGSACSSAPSQEPSPTPPAPSVPGKGTVSYTVDGRTTEQSVESSCSMQFFATRIIDPNPAEQLNLEVAWLRLGTYDCSLKGDRTATMSYGAGVSAGQRGTNYDAFGERGSCQLVVSQLAPRIRATFSGTFVIEPLHGIDPQPPVQITSGTLDTEAPTGGCVDVE